MGLLVLLALAGPGCQEGKVPPAVSVEGALLLRADEAGCYVRALGPSVTCHLTWPPGAGSQPYHVEVGNVLDPEHATIAVSVGSRPAEQLRGRIQGSSIYLTVDPVEGQVTEVALSSPDPPLPFTFAVLGDSQGHEEALAAALKKLATTEARFLVHLGDMVPAGEESQYRQFLETMQGWARPYYTVPGNHDVRGNGATLYRKELAPPCCSFTYGGHDFVFLDSSELRLDEDELAWLRGQITMPGTAPQPGSEGRALVFTHAPPFDPLAPGGGGHTLRAGAAEFMELMSTARVKGVFCGHIHLFCQRQVGETLYVISGGGGAALYAGPEQGGFHHFTLVTVGEDGIRIEAVPFPAPPGEAEVAVRGPDGFAVLTMEELKDMDAREAVSCFQNQFGNSCGQGKYRGVPVADLVNLVGGIRAGDRLVVHSADGFQQEFAYENVFPPVAGGGQASSREQGALQPQDWQRQGEMVLAYAFTPTGSQEEMTVPKWADGPRLVFLPADGEYSNEDCAATSALGMGWHTYRSAGARWVRNVTLIEVIR
ncbi:MAG TPA: hypothetical protein GX513_00990 [Firmicutes bacterium]|nr:hypothetical protein [Bacillota bacterium]